MGGGEPEGLHNPTEGRFFPIRMVKQGLGKSSRFCLSELFDLAPVMAASSTKPSAGESSKGKAPGEFVPMMGEGVPSKWWDPKDLLMPLSPGQLQTFCDYCERHNEQCPMRLEDPKALEVVRLMAQRSYVPPGAWSEMEKYALEVLRRHLWLDQVLDGTVLPATVPDEDAAMVLIPENKLLLRYQLFAFWEAGLGRKLGAEWHTVIEPFCHILKSDVWCFKWTERCEVEFDRLSSLWAADRLRRSMRACMVCDGVEECNIDREVRQCMKTLEKTWYQRRPSSSLKMKMHQWGGVPPSQAACQMVG